MKSQLKLDYTKARAERDAGIAQATRHADGVNKDWSERAYDIFISWLGGWPSGYRFMVENFRVSAYARGLERPPTDRAFASVVVRAKKAGLIKSNGQKPTAGVSAHHCYANEWQKI